PQSLLPRVFSRSARLRSRRTCESQVSRRNCVSVHSPKCPSLLLLFGGSFSLFSLVRRFSFVFLRWAIRNGRWFACSHTERNTAFALHVLLPFAATSCRRQAGLFFVRDIRAFTV